MFISKMPGAHLDGLDPQALAKLPAGAQVVDYLSDRRQERRLFGRGPIRADLGPVLAAGEDRQGPSAARTGRSRHPVRGALIPTTPAPHPQPSEHPHGGCSWAKYRPRHHLKLRPNVYTFDRSFALVLGVEPCPPTSVGVLD